MTNVNYSANDFASTQPPDYGLLPNSRPRGLWSQIGMVLFQPGRFFRTLATLPDNRQWVWVALLILILTGFSAVQVNSNAPSAAGTQAPAGDMGPMPGDPFSGEVSGGAVISSSEGRGVGPVVSGPFEESAGPEAAESAAESDPVADWTTALIAASNIVVVWIIVILLLAVVTLLRGVPPRWGHNVQIAIWASVPLGLMAALQLIYFFAGGKSGEPGMAGLLPEWDAYADLTRSQQALALSFASRLTLFSLWSVALVYLGGRHTLRGPWLVVVIVTLALVALVVAIPVVAGTIEAPEEEAPPVQPGELMGPDMMPGELPPGAEFPGGEAPAGDVGPGEVPLEGMPSMEGSGEVIPGGEALESEMLPGEGPSEMPPAEESSEAIPGDEAPELETSREGASELPPAAESGAQPGAIEVEPERVQ